MRKIYNSFAKHLLGPRLHKKNTLFHLEIKLLSKDLHAGTNARFQHSDRNSHVEHQPQLIRFAKRIFRNWLALHLNHALSSVRQFNRSKFSATLKSTCSYRLANSRGWVDCSYGARRVICVLDACWSRGSRTGVNTLFLGTHDPHVAPSEVKVSDTTQQTLTNSSYLWKLKRNSYRGLAVFNRYVM